MTENKTIPTPSVDQTIDWSGIDIGAIQWDEPKPPIDFGDVVATPKFIVPPSPLRRTGYTSAVGKMDRIRKRKSDRPPEAERSFFYFLDSRHRLKSWDAVQRRLPDIGLTHNAVVYEDDKPSRPIEGLVLTEHQATRVCEILKREYLIGSDYAMYYSIGGTMERISEYEACESMNLPGQPSPFQIIAAWICRTTPVQAPVSKYHDDCYIGWLKRELFHVQRRKDGVVL